MKHKLPTIDEPVTTCDGCGVCCLHMASPPYDEEERELLRDNFPEVYADVLAVEETRKIQLRAVGTEAIPCGFFDMVTRKCLHHAHNPDICHRYPVGETMCRQQRKALAVLEQNP